MNDEGWRDEFEAEHGRDPGDPEPALPADPSSGARAVSPGGPSLCGHSLASGRFEVLRRLGEGGAGVVYEAYDAARRGRVALKTLARLDAGHIYRLKREFRSLADVVHPNLIGLHELFSERGLWFFTMDLVCGSDFVRFVRSGPDGALLPPGEAPQLSRLRAAYTQLVEGVGALHRAGKLHCDLKPSNVLVTEALRLRILDFGLTIDMSAPREGGARETGLFGTPDYLAPERVRGGRATEAADWYAVGVVLYEALVGRLPYEGDRFFAAQERAAARWQAPHERVSSLPLDLSELCMRLLDADPERRPRAAQQLAALGAPEPERRPISSQPAGGEVELVGREGEMAALQDMLVRAERGEPVLVTLPGLSGMGKTALLTAFAAQVRGDARAVFLAGRCYERESLPYKTLDSLMDQLVAFWRRLPPAEAAALLPRDAFSLVRVFPVFARVEAITRAPQRDPVVRDPHELRRRAFRALRELLGRMGDRYTLVLAIDDLQWGDDESAREIVELLAPPDPPCMLVVCAYRADEVHAGGALDGLLSALAESRVVHVEQPVGPLSAEAAWRLAEMLTEGGEGRERVDDIVREAEGSPFFVGELARQGRRGPAQGPLRLSDVVQRRLAHLPTPERGLLELLVVAPGPVRGDVLREVSGLGSLHDAALRGLSGESLVRTRGGRAYDLVEPRHDRIREAVAERLSKDARRSIHESFAAVLELRGDADAEVLGAHLEGAAQGSRAAECYLRAAQQSLDTLAFDHAARLFRRAIDLGDYAPEVRAGLEAQRAEALAFAGRGPASARAYQLAASLGGASRRAEWRLRAAEQLLYAGHNEPALRLLADVLPRLGVRMPRSGPARLGAILFDAAKLSMSRPGRIRPASERDTEAARKATLCATLGDAVLYVDFGLFAYFQQRHVLHGFSSGEPGRVAEALTTRAMLTASPAPHRFDSVLADLEMARRLADESGSPAVRGRVMVSRAIVHSAAARYAETESLARQAEAIFRNECHGVKWGLQLAVLWQSVALFYLGRFRDVRALCREYLPEARARGDRMLSKILATWLAWAELAEGAPERAGEVAPELALDESFTILDGGVITLRAPLLLYRGRAEEAWELYREAAPLVRHSGILRARTRAFEFHWTRGLAGVHLLAQGADGGAARVLRRDIRELSRSNTTDSAAMAEQLRGALCSVRGEREAAAAHYASAADGYARRGMEAFALTLQLGAAHARDEGGAEGALRAGTRLTELGVSRQDAWLSLWCPGWDRV